MKMHLVLVLLLFCCFAEGAVYTYNLDSLVSGTRPGGPAPWLTVSFTDVGLNQVKMDVTTNGLSGGEFVGKLYANYQPSLNPNLLSFSSLNPEVTGSTTVATSIDTFKGGGGGSFDISFDFPQSAATRIGDNFAFSYLITSSDTVPLTADLFDFLSSPMGGNGTWPLLAHIQSIRGGKSAWIGSSGRVATPEPATYLMLASLLSLAMIVVYVRGGRTETNCSSSK